MLTVLAVFSLTAALTINAGAHTAPDDTVEAAETTVDPGHVGP